MGLLGLFGAGPLSEKKIAKISKLACNPHAQPDVRMREMQRLLSDGSDAALRGVLKRFAANASGHIADEDEKNWLEDALVDHGPSIIEPLRDYIREETQLTYALRAYFRLTGASEGVRFLFEVLNHHGPDSYRTVDAKLQLIWQAGEHLDDPEVIPGLCPFLLDHSDDVRWAVLDLVEKAADEGTLSDEAKHTVCRHLGATVTDDSLGPRIQRRAAEIALAREWRLATEATELAPALAEEYFLDKKLFIRKRVRKG